MNKENNDLLDLCRLQVMEENVKDSIAPDKYTTIQAINWKKRQLAEKITRNAPPMQEGAMERHRKANPLECIVLGWEKKEISMNIAIDKSVKEDRDLCIECKNVLHAIYETHFESTSQTSPIYYNSATGEIANCKQARDDQTCVNFEKVEA